MNAIKVARFYSYSPPEDVMVRGPFDAMKYIYCKNISKVIFLKCPLYVPFNTTVFTFLLKRSLCGITAPSIFILEYVTLTPVGRSTGSP
jgi:hypothetical protein